MKKVLASVTLILTLLFVSNTYATDKNALCKTYTDIMVSCAEVHNKIPCSTASKLLKETLLSNGITNYNIVNLLTTLCEVACEMPEIIDPYQIYLECVK